MLLRPRRFSWAEHVLQVSQALYYFCHRRDGIVSRLRQNAPVYRHLEIERTRRFTAEQESYDLKQERDAILADLQYYKSRCELVEGLHN